MLLRRPPKRKSSKKLLKSDTPPAPNPKINPPEIQDEKIPETNNFVFASSNVSKSNSIIDGNQNNNDNKINNQSTNFINVLPNNNIIEISNSQLESHRSQIMKNINPLWEGDCGNIQTKNAKKSVQNQNNKNLKFEQNNEWSDQKFSNWLELLMAPKISGPNPFPLREPLRPKQKSNLISELVSAAENQNRNQGLGLSYNCQNAYNSDSNLRSKLKIENNFDYEIHQFFNNSEQYLLKMNQFLNKFSNSSLTKMDAGKMILSSHNYQKITNRILNKLQAESKPLENTEDDKIGSIMAEKINYYDINEKIDLPPYIRKLPVFLQLKLKMLATENYLKSGLVEKNVSPTSKLTFLQENGETKSESLFSAENQVALKDNVSTNCINKQKTKSNSLKLQTPEDQVATKSDLYILYSLLAKKGSIINLRAHFIRQVPTTLNSIAEYVVFLNLSFNNINEIPAELFDRLTNLEVLQLRNNPLKKLVLGTQKRSQSVKGSLPKLKSLTVSYCLLETTPENIDSCNQLKSLDLSYNKLSTIDPNLGKLITNLKELDLSGNRLNYLPAEMLALNLVTLKISNNYINPIFWKSCIRSSAKSLRDIVFCHINSLENKGQRDQFYNKMSDEDKKSFNSEKYRCRTTGRESYGETLKVLRPCKRLWGKKMLPFVFECCSEAAVQELLSKAEIEC